MMTPVPSTRLGARVVAGPCLAALLGFACESNTLILPDRGPAGRDASESHDAAPADTGPAAPDATLHDSGVVLPDIGPATPDATADAGSVGCRGLDEAACLATMNCRADYCPDCPDRSFVGCAEPGDPVRPCPPPRPCPCDTLGEADCLVRPDCHGVFASAQGCACAPLGCCTSFAVCADGPHADCAGANLSCRRPAPYCETPYVISYVADCYEGCARRDDCAPVTVSCGAAGVTQFPYFGKQCATTADCAVALHQTDCCGNQIAIGIRRSEQARFAAAEQICRGQFPLCGCPAGPTEAEDGRTTTDTMRIAAECTNGFCMTFVR